MIIIMDTFVENIHPEELEDPRYQYAEELKKESENDNRQS